MTKSSILEIGVVIAFGVMAVMAINSNKEKRVVQKTEINKHQKVERVQRNDEEYQGRDRIMPAGMRSTIDRYIDPMGEMIDPYGLF